MRGGTAAFGQSDRFALDADGKFVLRARKRQPDAFLAAEQRAFAELAEDFCQTRRTEGFDAIAVRGRRHLASRVKRQGSRTFAPDHFEQAESISRRNTERAGQTLARALVG